MAGRKEGKVKPYSYGRIADNYIGIFSRPGKAIIFISLIILFLILGLIIIKMVI